MKRSARLITHDHVPVLIDNQTAVPLGVIHTAARFALPMARLGVSGVRQAVIRVRPYVADGTLGRYHAAKRPVLEVSLDPEGWLAVTPTTAMYPLDLVHDRLKDRYGLNTKLLLFSQVEYLTFILAHEARHLWQDRVSSRPWARPEYDADDAGMRALMALREALGPARGIGKVYPRRQIMDQPLPLRKAS